MLAQLNGGATAPPPKIAIYPTQAVRLQPDAKTISRPGRAPDPGHARPDLGPKPAVVEPLPPCKSPQAYAPTLTPYEVWLEQRHKWHGPPCDPFGPVYPALPGANKWRRLARGRELTVDEKREYGAVVLEGINALNAKLLDREVAPFRSNSASGTFHNNGKDILAAINAQNRAKCR